jgi:dienelactone hydrolase
MFSLLITRTTQGLADNFARNGFKVYSPDLFEGDSVPPDAPNPVCHQPIPLSATSAYGRAYQGSTFDVKKWLPNHSPEHTGKRLRKVIEGLKEQGITVFGATGYCYGGVIYDTFLRLFCAILSHCRFLQPVSCSISPLKVSFT